MRWEVMKCAVSIVDFNEWKHFFPQFLKIGRIKYFSGFIGKPCITSLFIITLALLSMDESEKEKNKEKRKRF